MYNIVNGYKHRTKETYFSDLHLKDEWQREVYLMAAAIMATCNYKSVFDLGCGSAYKLVHMLGHYETTGSDVEETLQYLRKVYPDRCWVSPQDTVLYHDLVICADVIEHVLDPDIICNAIKAVAPKHIIISTPDRDLYDNPKENHPYYGPPLAEVHVREWTFAEFRDYMETHFLILDHRVTGANGQPTQTVICALKS